MTNTIQFIVTKEQGVYTADAVNVPVVTEGSTFEELQTNIREAVALYLEDENSGSLGFSTSRLFSLTLSCPSLYMKGGLRVLSGKQVPVILGKFGFVLHSTDSGHFKLRHIGVGGRETHVVPTHSPSARGTLRAIYNQACRYVPPSELRPHFITTRPAGSQSQS
jgi:predicted RNase H-like HicB family nuclease/predicted RNA binding protein YcfA (HicA-like mRNA interferase family)